jgi:hypothetical protein
MGIIRAIVAVSDDGTSHILRWTEVFKEFECQSEEQEYHHESTWSNTPAGIYKAHAKGSWCGGTQCRCGYKDCFEWDWYLDECLYELKETTNE